VLGELRVALRHLLSIVAFVVGVILMRRFLRHLVVGSAVVLLGPVAHAWGPTDSKLEPAPSGFASRRDGVERGKIETVEYGSKSVGDTRKMTVYLPPGSSGCSEATSPAHSEQRSSGFGLTDPINRIFSQVISG
jgi:hypothetical protein